MSKDDKPEIEVLNTTDTDNTDVIKCIFLCEFHATAGIQVAVQNPKKYISKELFDLTSNYLIPKVQIQRCFVSVSLMGTKILGFPIRIDDKKYLRNSFYFNLCFVFDPQTRTFGYEPIIRKFTEYLLSLELSSRFLSQLNDSTRERLDKMLEHIRTEINKNKKCLLEDGENILPLCVVPFYHTEENGKRNSCYSGSDLVLPHKAPVLLDSFYNNYVNSQWDLTTLRIVPYINGFNHITRIAQFAHCAEKIVIECVKHLILLGVVTLVPVFQYANVYRPTPKLKELVNDMDMQKRAIDKCSKSELQKAKVRDILLLFASMANGATFGELCVRFNPGSFNINERKAVLFGLIENLIRPIFKYPITVSKNLFVGYEETNNKSNNCNTSFCIPITTKRRNFDNIQVQTTSFNGIKTIEEICIETGISSHQMEELISSDKHVIVLLK